MRLVEILTDPRVVNRLIGLGIPNTWESEFLKSNAGKNIRFLSSKQVAVLERIAEKYRPALEGELERALREMELERAEREAEVARALEVVHPYLSGEPFPDGSRLLQHQRQGVRELIIRRRMILADDMGLGKTRQALVAALGYQACGYRVVVLAPVSLLEFWAKEAEVVGVKIQTYGFTHARIPDIREGGKILLIADEAHYAQSLKSKRTQKFLALARQSQIVYLLTGTPMKNGRPANLFPLLVAIGHPLSANRRFYEARYCGAKPTRWTAWDTSGATNLPELREHLKGWILRRRKSECLDLPPKQRIFRTVEVTDDDLQEYDRVFQQARARAEELGDGLDEESARGLIFIVRHAASVAKVGGTLEILNELLEQGETCVVFTQFKRSAQMIHNGVIKLGYPSILLTGDVPVEQRQAVVDAFQSGGARVLVATAQTAGFGFTLTRAQTVILHDRPWTPADTLQLEDRLHRVGQRGSVFSIWISGFDVDLAVDEIILSKINNIAAVLGADESLSFVDLARRIFRGGR